MKKRFRPPLPPEPPAAELEQPEVSISAESLYLPPEPQVLEGKRPYFHGKKRCPKCHGQLNPTSTVNLVDEKGKRFLYDACPADCSGAVAKDLRAGPMRWVPHHLLSLLAVLLLASSSAWADSGSTYVRRSGDYMFGPLRISSSATSPLQLGPQSGTAERSVGFSGCAGSSCSVRLSYTPSTADWAFTGGNTVSGSQTIAWSGRVALSRSTFPALHVTGAGGAQFTGVATGSLPACTGTQDGGLEYDTTTKTYKWCNSSSWQSFAASGSSTWAAPWMSRSVGSAAITEDNPFHGRYTPQISTKTTIVNCSIETAGSGGSTGVVVGIYNDTTDLLLCSCNIGSCSTDGTASACTCSGTMTADQEYYVKLTTATDCATNPAIMYCTVALENP